MHSFILFSLHIDFGNMPLALCKNQNPTNSQNEFHRHQNYLWRTMNGSKLLIWIYLLLMVPTTYVESYIGINWGRMASQRMIPSMVVDMILQNGIREVKLFTASKNVLEAFEGTDIGITITIPNDDLKNITSVQDAKRWLQERVTPYINQDVKIRYISIGSQPFSSTYFNKTYYHAIDVLKHFQNALKEDEFAKRSIKATLNHFTDVLNEVKKPSEGEFRQEIREYMVYSSQLLNEDNAPMWLDMFPIYNVKRLFDNDIEFSFFDNNSPSAFMDGDNRYNNIFEVMYDTFICALRKVGISNLTIIAGEVGWPTDGIDGANITNARRFHKGFIKHILSGNGTPLYPGPIDAYIHNLADESKLRTVQGGFMRHWGIYNFDGKPKYNMDFSGQGRDIKPVTGKGVTHMPKRWCILNNGTTDMEKIKIQYDYACNVSDCTSMAPGGSCSNLAFPHNISYALNIFFQSRSQKVSEEACNFDGLGIITPDDPSTESCSFPVEILSAEFFGGNGVVLSNGIRHIMESKTSISLLLLLTIKLVLEYT